MKAWEEASRGEIVQISQSPPTKQNHRQREKKLITTNYRQHPIVLVGAGDTSVALDAPENEKPYPIDRQS
jgi:hypothetical protein